MLEDKIPEVSTELQEQPQLQHIQLTFTGHSLLSEEKRAVHLCDTAQKTFTFGEPFQLS